MTKLVDRRSALSFLSAGALGLLAPARAGASETTQYIYDARGRVVRVQFNDGSTVVYAYDDAGNRTEVARTSSAPTSVWTQTIAITGSGPVDLHSLAITAGYGGQQDANVTFTLASGVTILGGGGNSIDPAGPGIDTGDWPINQVYVALALQISGTVNGGGGGGGNHDAPGQGGGAAIYCRTPMNVTVNSGGVVKGGGGGGSGGFICCSPTFKFGGGGGGGGAPGGAGGEGDPDALVPGHHGNAATATTGGTGGTRGGATGANVGLNAAPGGSVGYAVRKNGFTVPVTNNGTIVGPVG